MCENLCCCVDDAKKEQRVSPELLKGDGDVSYVSFFERIFHTFYNNFDDFSVKISDR